MKSVLKINEMARENPLGLVEYSEEKYHDRLQEVASGIFENEEKRIIMLAGPSASGKTTSAKLISQKLSDLGAKTYTISLDDFYRNRSETVDENGEPDFESVNALDVDLIKSCITELLTSGQTDLPLFDFVYGVRKKETKHLKIERNDAVIFEGIHALNPIITGELPSENVLRLYVSVSSRISASNGEIIMTKRDLRFVRRLVRDFYHRASSVERTFELWDSVLEGEDKYIYPFSKSADERIDSFHSYEPCIFKSLAIPMLESVKVDSEFYVDAQRMIKKLSLFEKLDTSVTPETSLLNEFLR